MYYESETRATLVWLKADGQKADCLPSSIVAFCIEHFAFCIFFAMTQDAKPTKLPSAFISDKSRHSQPHSQLGRTRYD
jgi:hypothetical protein